MKRFIKKILILSVVGLMLTGCGKDKESGTDDKVKNDLIEFVNEEIPGIQGERDSAINKYNDYFNNKEVNPDDFLAMLESEAVPELTSYMEKLNAIEVETDEVKEIKELFVNSSNKQLEAMNYVVVALRDKDSESLNKAADCLSESQSYLISYESKLKLLAIDCDVEVVGEFTTMQSTSENVEGNTTTNEDGTVEESPVAE